MLHLEREIWHIIVARIVRMFGYGGVTVIFLLMLKAELPSSIDVTGVVLGVFLGDWVASLVLTTRADRIGRRVVLVLASILVVLLGLCFFFSQNVGLLAFGGVVGIVSPAGGDIGPFAALEQAIMSDTVARRATGSAPADHSHHQASVPLTTLLAWYQAIGGVAMACGALACGFAVHGMMQVQGLTEIAAYQYIYAGYACCGGVLAILYATLPGHCEPRSKVAIIAGTPVKATESINSPPSQVVVASSDSGWLFSRLGIRRASTAWSVGKLSVVFFVDAFAGGLVMQSYFSWWFHQQWRLDHTLLGALIMGANVIGGFSGLAAGYLVKRFGAVNTMVFTHFPSNVLLMLVIAMPTSWSAAVMLLLRYTISQMDVPARQAYVAAVVPADERAAGNGITMSVRSVAVASSILVLIPCTSASTWWWQSAPFLMSGAMKCAYDVAVYILFQLANRQKAAAVETSAPNTEPPALVGAAASIPTADDERTTLLPKP